MRVSVVCLFSMTLCLPSQIAAGDYYLGLGIGQNTSQDVTVASNSNDRASICDEFINPRATQIPNCTTASRGSGDGWQALFGKGGGLSTEIELGKRLSERIRIAVFYSNTQTNFDQTVSSSNASGVDFDKISNELAVGEETLGTVGSQGLFIAILQDWPNRTDWTPYWGIGIGAVETRLGFSWVWARNTDPAAISTGSDEPNSDEIRSNLAGTVSAGRDVLWDNSFGYSVIAGIDRAVTPSMSWGIKAQFRQFETFESQEYGGNFLLRSHTANLRLDGSEPVVSWSAIDSTARLSLLMSVRFNL